MRERQRGLINNLYDDMESHNSKAVSEIYLSLHRIFPVAAANRKWNLTKRCLDKTYKELLVGGI